MDAPRDLSPDEFLALRFACEDELARLGLTWKHERVRAFLGRCFPPRATVDCAEEGTLEALLEKLRAL